MWQWFIPPVLAALMALNFQVYRPLNRPQENAVYVIGDLHGDVHCAKYWVGKTGLVAEDGKWVDDSSKLIFLGDYIDKGPTSRQTIEYVKSLTDQFPEVVSAIIGNHELELLRDRDAVGNEWRWGGAGFFQLAYASVHPGEYLNFIDDIDSNDELVVEALYNASLEVYSDGKHGNVMLSPDKGGISILEFVTPELRALVKDRMGTYQKSYLDSFRSGTELGNWLERRPILAQVNNTLFVHGGISPDATQYLTKIGIDGINKLFASNANEDNLSDFLDRTGEGRAIYDMVTYRGNHESSSCPQLSKLLPDGISRLGVGHTPDYHVRLLCDGNFLALDSSLGRWYRNSGNEYCPGDKVQTSKNGRYTCKKMKDKCEGQIIRIKNGDITVIH